MTIIQQSAKYTVFLVAQYPISHTSTSVSNDALKPNVNYIPYLGCVQEKKYCSCNNNTVVIE